MSRLARFLLSLLVMLVCLGPPLVRAAEPLIPDRPDGAATYSGTRPLYEEFAHDVYTFEGVGQYSTGGPISPYFWVNALLVTKAWLLKTSLRVVEYALKVDFLGPFLDQVGSVLRLAGAEFWEGSSPWVAGALSLTGMWALLLYMGGRVTRVWATLGGTVLTLVLTTLVLTEGPGLVQTGNTLARAVSTEIFDGMERVAPTDANQWGLVGLGGDALWRALVYEPWLTGEFGAVAGETAYGQTNDASFLRKTVAQRTEICAPRSLVSPSCPWWADEHLPRRMVLAGWTLLATVAVGGTLLALAGGIIFAQMALLLILALSPVWLLVALWWPEQGRRLLAWVGLRALGALVVQTVLTITLGLLLLLSLSVPIAFSGWMLRSIILTVLSVAAFRYRTAWLEPLSTARRWGTEWSARQEREAVAQAPVRRTESAGRQGAVAAGQAPQFAGLAPGFKRTEHGSSGWLDEELDPAAVSVAQPGRSGLFRSEMQSLRERMVDGGEGSAIRFAVRSRAGETPTGALTGSTAAPRSAAETAQTAPPADAAARSAAAARQRTSDVTRLPNQRPRG